MTATNEVLDLVRAWAEAEQRNDAGALDGLLADDFVGVGPLGFVLDRQQWLDRFGDGLENRSFAVQDPQVRDYGTAAVVVGVLAHDRWLLANAHIGMLQTPAGPPPRSQ